MKALIVGSGSWGLAVGKVLCDNGHQVTVYARNPNTVREINYNHTNNKYFDNVILPREMVAVNELKDIDSYDFVVMATPSNVSVEVGKQIAELIDKKIIIVNLAKGFNPENHGLLSEEFKKVFGDKLECYAALLGPSHAEEVILGMQTTVNIVCEDEEYGKKLQKAFANDYFRVYLNTDMIGCQYGSSLKNIIAIASGILYGLGLGDNAKASLMTRGLAEMTRYGVHFGGRKETFMGLCGMGDLIVPALPGIPVTGRPAIPSASMTARKNSGVPIPRPSKASMPVRSSRVKQMPTALRCRSLPKYTMSCSPVRNRRSPSET